MSDKRNIILEAALQVFRKYGYAKASLSDVANESKKGRTSLYKYFRNKEDLFIATIEYSSADFFSELNNILLSSNTAVGKIKKYNSAKFDLIKTGQKLNGIIHKDIACDPALREIVLKTHGKVEIKAICKIILSGIKSGEFKYITPKQAKLTASVFFSMTTAHIYQLFEKDNIRDFEAACKITEEMFVSSLVKSDVHGL